MTEHRYPKLAVIYDVDGTLADVSGIRHYVTDDPKRKNFQKFHAAASYCRPNMEIVEMAQATARFGIYNFVVTARSEMWRYRTATWLRKWEVPYAALLMRADGDSRGDVEIKRDILARIREKGYRVVYAVDDNPSVIELWRSEGIHTQVVPGWDKKGDRDEQPDYPRGS